MPPKPRPRMGRPDNLPEPWKTMAERAGGVEKLAAMFGVASSVLRRWAHGRMGMAAPSKALFDRLYVELRDKK